MIMREPIVINRIADPLRTHFAHGGKDRDRRFAIASEATPVLAPFANDAEATRFAKDETNPQDDRADVVRALVLAYQRDGHAMWSNCILAVFDKVLRKLVHEFRKAEPEESELAQIFTRHLLEVARTIDAKNPRILILWRVPQYARDLAMTELGREKRHRQLRGGRFVGTGTEELCPDEGDADAGPPVSHAAGTHAPAREAERYRRVIDALKEGMSAEDLGLLTFSVDHDGLLKDEFATTEQVDSVQQRRQYEAAKRKRTRLYERARKILRDAGLWDALGPGLSVPALGL